MTVMGGAVSAPCRLWRLPAVSVLYEWLFFYLRVPMLSIHLVFPFACQEVWG